MKVLAFVILYNLLNGQVNDLSFQLVTIKGSPESCTEACKEIYKVVQTEAQSLNKG